MKTPPKTLNTVRFGAQVILGVSAWFLIAYKAWTIPITHDELATVIHYTTFSPWEIMMYPDPWPSNHILNTLLAKASLAVFGGGLFAARLPSVLSFGLYAGAAFGLARLLFPGPSWPRLLAFTLFIANPYLLDFFSVCRGYGMANALLLASGYGLVRGYLHRKPGSIWAGIGLATAASYANFTLLVYGCAALAMGGLFFLTLNPAGENRAKRALPMVGLGLLAAAYGALIWTPIQKMQRTDQFQYWEANSFFQDTIISLVRNTRYGSAILGLPDGFWGLAAVLFCIVAFGYGIWALFRNGWAAASRQAWFIALGLLGVTILVNRLQHEWLHTPNLTNRTALLFFPLFILVCNALLVEARNFRPKWVSRLSALLWVLVLWHLLRTVNTFSVREWWYDAYTFEVADRLKTEAEERGGPVRLATNWHFHPSFNYYQMRGETPWIQLEPYSKTIEPQVKPDFYYVFHTDQERLEEDYLEIESFNYRSFILMKRRAY